MVAPPHGGKLIDIPKLSLTAENIQEINNALKLVVPDEVAVTIRNLSEGVLSPLEGFMTSDEYESVINNMRLSNDLPWTIPVVLNVPENSNYHVGEEVTLVNSNGDPLASLILEEIYEINRKEYAKKVFQTTDASHPGVAKIYNLPKKAVGGRLIKVVKYPSKFENYTLYPRETRVLFREKGWKEIVAFQTRNVPHIGHEYVQKTALAFADGIFINPVLGRKKKGDFKDEVILDAYKVLLEHYYPKSSTVLSVLHYEMQYAGPKEAVMHAIMRKNFGCTHIAIGRDHAGVGSFYNPYAAHEIFKEFPDIGITPLFFREFFYCRSCRGIASDRTCPHSTEEQVTFSGTKLRQMIESGQRPPAEFMRPEVVDVIFSYPQPFW